MVVWAKVITEAQKLYSSTSWRFSPCRPMMTNDELPASSELTGPVASWVSGGVTPCSDTPKAPTCSSCEKPLKSCSCSTVVGLARVRGAMIDAVGLGACTWRMCAAPPLLAVRGCTVLVECTALRAGSEGRCACDEEPCRLDILTEPTLVIALGDIAAAALCGASITTEPPTTARAAVAATLRRRIRRIIETSPPGRSDAQA